MTVFFSSQTLCFLFLLGRIFAGIATDPVDWTGWRGLVAIMIVFNGLIASAFKASMDVRDRIRFDFQAWSFLARWLSWLQEPAQKMRVLMVNHSFLSLYVHLSEFFLSALCLTQYAFIFMHFHLLAMH